MTGRSWIGRSGKAFAAAVLLLVLLAVAGGNASGSGAKPFKFKQPPYRIGAVLGLTGVLSGVDKDTAASLRATVAEINAKGGVNGHKLVYRILDDQSDPSKAALAAQKLVDEYKPHFLVPDIPCFLALSALPIASRARLITFTGCDNGIPSIPANFPYNFSTYPPATVISVALVAGAAHVLKGRKMKVGFLNEDSAGSNALAEPLKAVAIAKGHTWVGNERFATGTPDLTVQLSKLRRAGADVVILFGRPGDGGNTMKSLRDLAWDVQVIGGDNVISTTFYDEVPAALRDNVHAVVTAISVRKRGSNVPPPWINTWLRRQSRGVQTLAVVGAVHDGITYWKWAVERTKSVNANRVRRELEKLHTLPQRQWPKGMLLTVNPMYSPRQHGLRNANLSRGWGVVRPSRNIMGTYEGEVFTCYCTLPNP